MTTLENDILIKALMRQPTSRTPIWIMRQAGRYLPEYKLTRRRAGSFLELAKNPNLAAEVTLQPVERFDLDAAIVFSDILTIPDAMGLGLRFVEGEGPFFHKPIRNEEDVNSLVVPDPYDKLRYVIDAIEQSKKSLKNRIPLIGFSGSPFTLACYQIEGRGGTDFSYVKKMLYDNPSLFHKLLSINTRAVIDYLNAQINAGANAIMLFDTWGGILSYNAYIDFSLKYLKKILEALLRESGGHYVPKTIFTKGGGGWLDLISSVGADAVGVDWQVDLGLARNLTKGKVALQGNLDPAVMLASPEIVRREAEAVLKSFGKGKGHVFNLGHGISQHTDPENVKVLVETVKQKSPMFH